MTADPVHLVPARYRVSERRVELADTVTLTLEPADEPLAIGSPGQFNMLWAFGIGEVPISIAGYHPDGSLEHTIRSVGAVTTALCAAAPGSMLGVRGPFGTGFDLAAAYGRDLLVIAGGIGLAPLRSVILESSTDRARFRRVTVLVGARSPVARLYPDAFDGWRASGIDVEVIVDAAPAGWTGEVGVVTRLIPRVIDDPSRTVAMMCGPEVMMRFAAAALMDNGVPGSAIQVSLERNMQCAVGLCGRCQLGATFVCRNGPVVTWPTIAGTLRVRER